MGGATVAGTGYYLYQKDKKESPYVYRAKETSRDDSAIIVWRILMWRGADITVG